MESAGHYIQTRHGKSQAANEGRLSLMRIIERLTTGENE